MNSFSSLRLFRDIVQMKSMSRGAELNGISASAATQQIQELERNLGVVLLDRTRRPFSLTVAGRLYNDFCRDVLRRRDEFTAAVDQVRTEVEGTVRVASIYSIGLSEMSELEDKFRRRQPGLKLTVDYLRPEKVYEAVVSDRADVGLVSYPEPTREIAVIPWRREEMALIVRPSHPLTLKHCVRPEDLAGQEFVAFDEDLPIRSAIDQYLLSHDVEVKVAMHFDNVQMIKEAVAIGSGVSIVPKRVLRPDISRGRLVSIPLATPGLQRPLGIIHRRRKKFHKAARLFLDLLQESPSEVLAPAYAPHSA